MNLEKIAKENISKDWLKSLGQEFKQDYFSHLNQFIDNEISAGKTIYPQTEEIFSAFNLTNLKDVKLVIFGQDPYHGPNQAHGLSFSVKKGIKTPPSLRNIYKELSTDVGFEIPEHGYLKEWANQGVLLLNAVLTVEATKAASHQKKGWEKFTDKVVSILNNECENLVFLLWGSHAQKKGANINREKHLVLDGPHPSPLSAHRGFFGRKQFSMANQYLIKHGKTPIDWQLTQ